MPEPLVISPSSHWAGNDGRWNTFQISVGVPAQDFHVLPSTATQEFWLPDAQGCAVHSPSDPGYCGYLRGAIGNDGQNSSGFTSNGSTTWDLIGIYTLDDQEEKLGYSGNGKFGYDTVSWDGDSKPVVLQNQVVGSLPGLEYWLGVIGVGPINFTTFDEPLPSMLSQLVDNETIPSLSWAYTAGASYRNESLASLTLGGFDDARSGSPRISVNMNPDTSRPLQVAVKNIIAENTLGGTGVSLLPEATYHFVDSTVPHLWLPDDAITLFVENFGLTYDNDTDLFLINDTMRDRMRELKPTVTFILGGSTIDDAESTLNLELPFAALDLQASFPFYQNATNYIPIRRARNDSQYTLGRTLFQELYIAANFELQKFNISQALTSHDNEPNIFAIPKALEVNSRSSNSTEDGISDVEGDANPRIIAGSVVGALAAVVVAAGLVWLVLRRQRMKRKSQNVGATAMTRSKTISENDSEYHDKAMRAAELPFENAVFEAAHGKPEPAELGTDARGLSVSEVEGDLGTAKARPGMVEMAASPMEVHELPLPANAFGNGENRHV
ncbi:acid protease [Hortaea werneckii]|nr:acid protease [Hortaea werneckii]KAI7017035.1 acid protease [Hortaea werneckii]KAI7204048.1 acid protease [Hortaea werneckii]KAI7595127.1 acid protease [Hortaea werneckii]KAI7671330.1 acid protease [Hortaea werneckii]